WERAGRLMLNCKNELLHENSANLENALARLPPDYLLTNFSLVHLKADCEAESGNLTAALTTYKDALSRTGPSIAGEGAVSRYRKYGRGTCTTAGSCAGGSLLSERTQTDPIGGRQPSRNARQQGANC